MNEMATRQRENERLREQLAQRDVRVKKLEEQLRLALARQFGTSSEKASPDQYGLFNEAENETDLASDEANCAADNETITVKSHQRTAKPRVSIPNELPREEIIYDIPEEEKVYHP